MSWVPVYMDDNLVDSVYAEHQNVIRLLNDVKRQVTVNHGVRLDIFLMFDMSMISAGSFYPDMFAPQLFGYRVQTSAVKIYRSGKSDARPN